MSLTRPRVRDDRGRASVRGVPIYIEPFFFTIAVVGTAVGMAAFAARDLTFEAFLLICIIVCPCLLCLVVAGWRGATGSAAVERAKARGKCPACGYDLKLLPREHDGCTVCPECGAAWRLPR